MAKAPKKSEIDAMKLKLALRWPDESKPIPLPFGWGEYDRQYGDTMPGTYWVVSGRYVHEVTIRQKLEGESGWQPWRFSVGGGPFSNTVQRGHLFQTERDARLYRLWVKCEEAARELLTYWEVTAAS